MNLKSLLKLTGPVTVLLTILTVFVSTAGYGQNSHPYKDISHHSKVFGKEKTYRIYLPDSYEQSNKSYPVIYFFHGWGGRYFKDDNAKLEYEKLGEIVNKYQAILVMWDGSMEESEPRPYNIGYHQDIKYNIQMKDYLPELVSCIDSSYRTLTDRGHRGIIGFSMGGILSFYLAGKYPDMFSAAVNMVGSPEFFIGLPENHTLYQVRYMFDNLREVGLLFHNRDSCQMSGLNDEVNKGALWSEMKNYEYHKMKGGHKVDDPGETRVFESAVKFVCDQFARPVSFQKGWSHYDQCPDFSVWGYTVKSNKDKPGFLYLKNADADGFGYYTTQWLPGGPAVKNCKATIITAPLYQPNKEYNISNYNTSNGELSMTHQLADKEGRLHFELMEGFEIGILSDKGAAGFAVVDYHLNGNKKMLNVNKSEGMVLHIFNRDGSLARAGKLKVSLTCADPTVDISSLSQTIHSEKGQYLIHTRPFKITTHKMAPSDGSPEYLRIKVKIEYDGQFNENVVVIPVYYDAPYFKDIMVDDGRPMKVKLSNTEKGELMDMIYPGKGSGNGDGLASKGEQIMLYQEGHRLKLFTDDPYVIAADEKLLDEVIPSVWPDGFTLSSIIKIAPDCPAGHVIEFIGHYETKTWFPIYRQVKWGKVKLTVN